MKWFFFVQNWFLRGFQSAIFYYVTCTPWKESLRRRNRRNEAKRAAAGRADDGNYVGPFQTNEEWAEEILAGPGPPKGWKRDPIYHKYVNQMREIPDYAARRRVEAKNLKREYADVRLGEMEEWRQELDRAGLKKPSPIKTPQREPSIIPPPDIPVKVGPETNNTPTTAKAKALQTPNAAYTPYSPINTTTPQTDTPTIINIPDVIIDNYDALSLSPTFVAERSGPTSPSRISRPVTADGACSDRDSSPTKSSTAVESQKSVSPVKSTKQPDTTTDATRKNTWLPSSKDSQMSGSRRASFESGSEITWDPNAKPKRPSIPMERRLSTAVDTVKETLRNTFYPENWNWMRYDRDEEVLSAFNKFNRYKNKLMSRMTLSASEEDEHEEERMERLRRQVSDKQKWQRGYHPAINDLHPPVASQLPATREDASWMLLPPPSADVMAGRARPGADDHLRKPLCVIDRPLEAEARSQDDLYPTPSDEAGLEGRGFPWGAPVDDNSSVPGWVSLAVRPRAYRESTV